MSDKVQPLPAQLRVRVMDFRGNILFEKTQDITVPELSSKVFATYSREELLKGTDAQHVIAVVDLMQGGTVVSRNNVLFDRVRNLVLPTPTIQAEVSGSAGTYTLRLQSATMTRHVYVSFGDNETELSDNYFDLLPNEAVTLQVKSKAELDQLRSSLKVRNITDAFPNAAN